MFKRRSIEQPPVAEPLKQTANIGERRATQTVESLAGCWSAPLRRLLFDRIVAEGDHPRAGTPWLILLESDVRAPLFSQKWLAGIALQPGRVFFDQSEKWHGPGPHIG